MPFKCGKHASDFLGMSILGAFLIKYNYSIHACWIMGGFLLSQCYAPQWLSYPLCSLGIIVN